MCVFKVVFGEKSRTKKFLDSELTLLCHLFETELQGQHSYLFKVYFTDPWNSRRLNDAETRYDETCSCSFLILIPALTQTLWPNLFALSTACADCSLTSFVPADAMTFLFSMRCLFQPDSFQVWRVEHNDTNTLHCWCGGTLQSKP